MLVVTANWAFTDGTVVAAAGRGRVGRAWLRGVRRAVVRSGFGRDGAYRPPDGLDIVLAGDTFDCLASTSWSGRDRPWRSGARADEARRRVILGCARRAAPFLAALAALARRGLRVPSADRRGRPSAATSVGIPVRITLLPGDRDRSISEVAAEFAARAAVVAPCWSDGAVFARHGHEFDPACHVTAAGSAADRPPTLVESVAADLLVPFAVALSGTGAVGSVARPLVAALVDSAPAELPGVIAEWGGPAGPGGAADDAVRRSVVAAWRRAVEAWLRQARREPPDCGLAASPIEPLAAWFHAADGGAPPGGIAALFDRAAPASAAGHVLVLGHPPPWSAAICLGRPPVRRWSPLSMCRGIAATEVACVPASPAPAGPATVACRLRDGRPEWLWPGAADAAGGAGAGVEIIDAA
ncbi:MAG: hypothetical protein ACKOZU_11980 [Planctomycetaceae bacterium]